MFMNAISYFTAITLCMALNATDGTCTMEQKQIQLPRPTGSYNVGMRTHLLKDVSRTYNGANGRPLLVHLYYPTAQAHAEYPPYLADAMYLYKEKLALSYNSEELAYLDRIQDWAIPDAPIDVKHAPLPVLFFSPGFLMAAQLYSSLIEEMASHGYVVIAINHTDACWPVLFPDGSSPAILPELADVFSNKERSCLQTFDMTQKTWIQDVEFVLSWLCDQQPLAQSLDLSNKGIFGHSFGGSTATEAARRNYGFKAMANLDGMLFGPHWDQPVEIPSLFVVAEQALTHEEALKAGLTIEQCDSLLARSSKKVFDQLQDNSFYVTVKNADHASFVDSKLIKSPLRKGGLTYDRCIEITRRLLVDFFDRYLKNRVLILLNDQSTDAIIVKK